jgi:hypothetical protein
MKAQKGCSTDVTTMSIWARMIMVNGITRLVATQVTTDMVCDKNLIKL